MKQLLAKADTQAMVIAHPRLAVLLRPVLRMLNQPEPDWFPAAPKRARAKRRAWTRPRSDYPGQRAAAENAAEAEAPTEGLARFVERVRLHTEALQREMLYLGWIWINGRPAIPPRREDNSPPPPPPPAPERWGGAHSWDWPAVPWWARGCR